MGNIYTGSNSGKAGLNVKKTDNTVDVFGVSQIQLGNNMTLLDNGNGSVTINSTGGGGGGSGVTELSFGSTGLTPAVATTGSITVAGTLEVGSGGTGLNSLGSADEFLKVNNGATALEYSAGLTYVSTAGSRQLKIVDTGVDDMFVVESTDSDATNAPDVKLFRNSSSPAQDDLIGVIKFNANDTNGDEQNYARIEARTDFVIPNLYGGSLDFYVINDATEIRMVTISGESIGTPNAMFHVNPDSSTDGDFQHSGSGGVVNIFSDAQNRQLEFTTIRKYEGVTPAAGKVMIGDGNFLNLGDLTSTGGTITIDTTTNPGDINLDIDSSAIISGSGAANQITLWSGANTLTGDAGFTFTDSAGVQTFLVSGSEPRIQTQDTTSAVGSRATITLDPSVPDGTGGVAMFWGTDADLELYMKLGAFAGANNIETKSRDFRFFGATGNLMTMDESALNTAVGGIFGLANGSDPLPLPTRTLDVGKEDSSTNTVLNILGLTRQSSGTPAVGIGVGMDFVVETSANNNEIGATIEAITTNVGSTTEAFDFTFNLMAGGATAAEKMRIASTGAITFNQAYTFPVADGNPNEFLQTDGAGNLSFAAGGGSGTPAGSDTEIQFNNAGAFGADAGLTYDSSSTPKMLKAGDGSGSVNQPVAFTQFAYDATDYEHWYEIRFSRFT